MRTQIRIKTDLFDAGRMVMTPGIAEALESEGKPFADFVFQSVARHLLGDWGDVSEGDKVANDADLIRGGRLFSGYSNPAGRIWIITEADRSATTILFPNEY